jgi:hypothetical protein
MYTNNSFLQTKLGLASWINDVDGKNGLSFDFLQQIGVLTWHSNCKLMIIAARSSATAVCSVFTHFGDLAYSLSVYSE